MRIDLLHYTAAPIIGGVESVITHHSGLMADAGHEVRILAGRGGQTDPRIPLLVISLVDSRNPEILSVKSELDKGCVQDKFFELVDQLCVSLSEALCEVDVLIVHNVCSLHKNLPLTAALNNVLKKPGSPRMILWHHDLAWSTARYRSELYPDYPWNLLASHWPGAEHVAVSDLRCQELSELTGISSKDIKVIPNGVDIAQFLNLQEQTRSFVDDLDLTSAEPLLLLPVRITPRKNIELALRTIAALKLDFPNPVLVISGPLGPHNPANAEYLKYLQALCNELGIQERVHLLTELSSGYLPDSVVADLYRLSDALFLPSREEGFGIPILEAGLSGLPIFCTAIAPLSSLAMENADYFYPDADPEQVALLIYKRLVNDPGYQMRVRVRKNYTWTHIYRQYIQPLLEQKD